LISSVSLFDIFDATHLDFKFRNVSPHEALKCIDLFHGNSLEWMKRPHLYERNAIYSPDHILVSLRHQNCIAIINWKTRKLEWVWGRGEIRWAHDATLLENGNILIFDNGYGRKWSRVIEMNPLTEKIVWEYRGDGFYTKGRGSAQRLPNGNTLLANSNSGQAMEVTPEGEIVWEFWNPQVGKNGHRIPIIRMKRFEIDVIEKFLSK